VRWSACSQELSYELRPLSASRTLLALTSEHRVSTRFNFYTIRWANRVMSSIKSNILYVLRAREEQAQRAARVAEISRFASDTLDDREGKQPGLDCRLTRVATTFEWLPHKS
jgi:hypothetical protein